MTKSKDRVQFFLDHACGKALIPQILRGADGQAHVTKYYKHIRMRLDCVEPLDLDSRLCWTENYQIVATLWVPCRRTLWRCQRTGTRSTPFVEISARRVEAWPMRWRRRRRGRRAWTHGSETGTRPSSRGSRYSTFDSEGQNSQDMWTLLGEAVQFLTGGGPGAEIHRFPTEDCGSCHWFSRKRRPRSDGTGEGRPGVDQ